MFKKTSIIAALSTALLFGGVFQSTVDASASEQAQNQSQNKTYYYSINGNWQQVSYNDFNSFLSKYFPNYNWSNVTWKNDQQKQEQPKQEQPKQEQPKQEQPKQEQPKQEKPAQKEPVKKPAQNKVEKPAAPVKQQNQAPAKTEQTQAPAQVNQLNQFEQEVVELTNNERAKHGLSPLKADGELSRVAREKSRDMAVNGYFSHNSPTYGSPFDMMKSWGITYRTAGENIAKGQRTPAEVVNAWMNSEGHRANILNGNFTHIGVGYVEQGNVWTQQFIGK